MDTSNSSTDPDKRDPPDSPGNESGADPKDIVIAKLRAQIGSLERQLEATAQQRDQLLDLLQLMNEDIREIRGMLKEKIDRTPPAEPSEGSSTS